MATSISSLIAQLVMEDLEKSNLGHCNIHLPFFDRYVDDCITAIPNGHQEKIKKLFNSYHEKLQFTIELEHGNKISL